MDPLSALSVASSAIQIFDFSSKVWKQIREVYESDTGMTLDAEALRNDARRLRSFNSGLSKLLAPENLRRMPTTTEGNVVALCNEGDDAANAIIKAIENLTLSPEHSNQEDESTYHDTSMRKRKATHALPERTPKRLSRIRENMGAIRIAVKGVWMKKDVDKLCERMDAAKRSLASAILVNIQHGIIGLDQKLDFLAAKPVEWESANSFEETLRSRNLNTPHNEAKLVGFLEAYESYASRASLTSVDEATEISLPQTLRLGYTKLEPWSATSHHIVQSFMKSLSFSEIFQRQESIHDNYKGTFQWIYHPPRDVDLPWDNFSTWLTEGRGIYWVTGKAGSGKSTLMRMLHHNRRTHELLQVWGDTAPLVTASFFFWNSGSKIQMSQDGLIRSVLLQIIEQRFQQGDCDTLSNKLVAFAMMLSSFQDIGFKDLLQLFRLVIEDGESSVKFFLIMDGLDEFDGDKSRLISIIHTLGMYDHVKVCVSSRPWVVFEDGFRQQPSLILQHLSHHDILLYVKESLKKEPSFRELSWADPLNASELIDSITKKACGVFLWVVLVVNSLIKGLADGDRIRDLEARLEELPEELEELFSKMLHGLEGRYFQDAARIFQIHRATRWTGFGAGTRIHAEFVVKLPLLIYSLADEHGFDHDAASKWFQQALTEKERFMKSISMKRRINGRCNGLLEIDEPATISGEAGRAWSRQLDTLLSQAEAGDLSVLKTLYSYGRNLAHSNIQYLHRTVRDYLEAPDIWRSIECATPATGEEYWILSLCLGYIILWKTGDEEDLRIQATRPPMLQTPPTMPSSLSLELPSLEFPPELTHGTILPSPVPQSEEDRKNNSWLVLENCFQLATNLFSESLESHVRFLNALGAALFDGDAAKVECNRQEVLSSAIWRYDKLDFIFEDFLALAVHLNRFAYVDTKISPMPAAVKVATASRLLIVATVKREQWLDQGKLSLQRNLYHFKAVCGIDEESDHTPEPSMGTEHDLMEVDIDEVDNPSFHMMQILMRHGADPDFVHNGTSARQILNMRRSELASSRYFRKVLGIIDSTRDDFRGFTRKAKNVFQRKT